MTLIKSAVKSVSLLLILLVIVLSNLFYHVSAVKVFESNRNKRFISTFEGLHAYSKCSWISSTTIVKKVITLNCVTRDNEHRVLHINEKYQILSYLRQDEVHLVDASSAFSLLNPTQDFKISTTFYKDLNVYWVSSTNVEWLLDIKDYTIIWKVDKNYE